jgi:RHS repeat-associated protein
MLMELRATPEHDKVVASYTWGLDLAGQANGAGSLPGNLESAGGIGGLLAACWPNAWTERSTDLNVAYCYDGNGNVTQVVDWAHDPNDPSGALMAKYEYDPYGNVIAQGGWHAGANHFRFSTKFFDDETGLGYWGFRYYSPSLGRWISRDPIDHRGGANIYCYTHNTPSGSIDPRGHAAQPTSQGCCNCGPDITKAVVAMLRDIDGRFATYTGDFSDLCSAYIGPANWDSDSYSKPNQFKTDRCPRGGKPCAFDHTTTGGIPGQMGGMPVTVFDKCYASFDVNYVVYGRMARNCDNFMRALFWFERWKSPWPSRNDRVWLRYHQARGWLMIGYFGTATGQQLPAPPAYLLQCAPCSDEWKRPIRWRAGINAASISGGGGTP